MPYINTPHGMAFMGGMPEVKAKPVSQAPSKKATVDLSKESVLILDYGYYCGLAAALGGKDGYGQVFYGTNWHGYCPTPDKCFMGMGVPGLIHVEEHEDYVDLADIIAFFDVGDYAKQRALKRQGKKVFGGAGTELIELNREYFKRVLEQAGLSTPPFEVIVGIDNLRAYLEKNEDVWVKGDSKWRGLGETFYHQDWETSYTTIDAMAHDLGCFRNAANLPSPPAKWVVEQPWPGIETGCDFFVSDGICLPVGTYGYEAKDEAYICKVMPLDHMPKAVKTINDGMAPFYAMSGMGGMASTEVRILNEEMYGFKPGEPYFLDATQRAGSPPAEIISGLYTNLPHVIRACANGEMITPAPRAKYAAQIILKSALASCEPCPVSVDKGFENSIRFRRQCVIDGQTFIIPMGEDDIIGAAVGYGRTKEEAQEMALEAADKVHTKELFYNCSVFDDLDETLMEAEELGLGVF